MTIFAPEVERGAIPPNTISVITTEERLAKFALGDRIFYVGASVDPAYVNLSLPFISTPKMLFLMSLRFESHCQNLGTVIVHLQEFDSFFNYLPREYVYFFNNQPGFRIVVSVTATNKGLVEKFVLQLFLMFFLTAPDHFCERKKITTANSVVDH